MFFRRRGAADALNVVFTYCCNNSDRAFATRGNRVIPSKVLESMRHKSLFFVCTTAIWIACSSQASASSAALTDESNELQTSVVKLLTHRRHGLSRSRVRFTYWRVFVPSGEPRTVSEELATKLRQSNVNAEMLREIPQFEVVEESEAILDIDLRSERIFRWENWRSNDFKATAEKLLRSKMSQEHSDVRVMHGPTHSVFVQNGESCQFLNTDTNQVVKGSADAVNSDITPEQLDLSFIDWRPSLVTGPPIEVATEISSNDGEVFLWKSTTSTLQAKHSFAAQDGFPLSWQLSKLDGKILQIGWATSQAPSTNIEGIRTVQHLFTGKAEKNGVSFFLATVHEWSVGDSLPAVDVSLQFASGTPQVTIDRTMDSTSPEITVHDPAIAEHRAPDRRSRFVVVSITISVSALMFYLWFRRRFCRAE